MRLAWAVALAALGSACSHAAPPKPRPEVFWPEPPADARARLSVLFPDPDAPPPPRPAWRKVLDFLFGSDDGAADPWLVRPFGVAAVDGAWLAADPDAQAVLRMNPGASEPARVTCKDREWSAPMALVAGPGGALFVADSEARVIVVVEPTGACRVLGAGLFERPTGVAVIGDRVFVADPGRHEVIALSTSGELVARWGGLGEGEGQFHFPTALAAAPDGTLLVVDALNFRVARLSPDGAWLGQFGAPGDAGGGLVRPKGVAADGAGRVYVSDAQRDLVLVFDQAGSFLYSIGASGGAPGYLALPAGVAVGQERLYVADSYNRRVQVFDLVGGSP